MLLVISKVSAAQVDKQVVDKAVDKSDANTVRLEAHFNMPVNYLWHYPKTSKNIFFIAVQPIVAQGQYDLAIRQKVPVPASLSNIVENLNYDGSEPNSRFLVVETRKAVKLTVRPEGTNNLVIEFSGIEPPPAAHGNAKNKKEGQSGDKN